MVASSTSTNPVELAPSLKEKLDAGLALLGPALEEALRHSPRQFGLAQKYVEAEFDALVFRAPHAVQR